MKATVFTEEQLEEIKSLREAGLGTRTIAEKLGIKRCNVNKAYVVLSLKAIQPKEKIIFSDIEKANIIDMYNNQNMGTRAISKKLGHARRLIKNILSELNVLNSDRKTPRVNHLKIEHMCPHCGISKPVINFRIKIDREDRISYSICNSCASEYDKIKKKLSYDNKKMEPGFILRRLLSSSINRALKKQGTNKNGESCMKYVQFTINQFLDHIEKQFEYWQTWANYGIYDPETWNDNDYSTWKWHLDHIIPQSDLPYTSMEDENFKKCWALENLRPYSAKQNIIDGTSRIRHKNNNKNDADA